jgi:NADH-quinone oxidoreductase subunit J
MLATDIYVAQQIGFGIIAAMMIVGAVRVVTTKNVVHAALWLVVVLAGAAAQYLLLDAEFVAITQVLVYIGAVMVLFLFGTMLTRARVGMDRDLDVRNGALIGLPVALLLLGTLSYGLIKTYKAERLKINPAQTSVRQISDSIFGQYLLPFEALSFVLLAAVIGAIVLARRD